MKVRPYECGLYHPQRLPLYFDFEHASEAAHLMSFEMGEINHEVIIGKMAPDKIILKVCCITHGQQDASFLVHDIDRGNLAIASLFNGTPMVGRV